jgi:hypothetical protein
MLAITFRSARSRHALSVTAALAGALATACADDPIAPNRGDSAPSAAVAKPAPTPSAGGTLLASLQVRTPNDSAWVPGTTARFLTDKGILTVADNGPGDTRPEPGIYGVVIPVSTYYKAELASVPIGYALPTTQVTGKKIAWSDVVNFPRYILSAKKTITVNLLDAHTKKRTPGATVAVTSPGMDLKYTITDGGAGDLTVLGAQAPADGLITVYLPSATLATWNVCETLAPAGYMLADPACQSGQTAGSWPSLVFNFLHQVGIVAPPDTM